MRSASLFFCYEMTLRFKNAQFPVKTAQQLSQMPSLKQWQESFLLTFISAFPPHPFPLSEDWIYWFLYETFYIYVWGFLRSIFSWVTNLKTQRAPLSTSPLLFRVWVLFGSTPSGRYQLSHLKNFQSAGAEAAEVITLTSQTLPWSKGRFGCSHAEALEEKDPMWWVLQNSHGDVF